MLAIVSTLSIDRTAEKPHGKGRISSNPDMSLQCGYVKSKEEA